MHLEAHQQPQHEYSPGGCPHHCFLQQVQQVEVADIVRMACRNFGIDQAEQRSPQRQDQGNEQEQDNCHDPLFLDHFHWAHHRVTSIVSH